MVVYIPYLKGSMTTPSNPKGSFDHGTVVAIRLCLKGLLKNEIGTRVSWTEVEQEEPLLPIDSVHCWAARCVVFNFLVLSIYICVLLLFFFFLGGGYPLKEVGTQREPKGGNHAELAWLGVAGGRGAGIRWHWEEGASSCAHSSGNNTGFAPHPSHPPPPQKKNKHGRRKRQERFGQVSLSLKPA